VRGLLITRAKVALCVLALPDVDRPRQAEANALLCQALGDAQRLRIPEAATIEGILEEHGLECPDRLRSGAFRERSASDLPR